MRLLNTRTQSLATFISCSIPPYAILSHTWGPDELTFEDLWLDGRSRRFVDDGSGSDNKITSACAQALEDDYEWIWIDTVCIDKSSSAELSEAINSMWTYYRKAGVCYAYLGDVVVADSELGESEKGEMDLELQREISTEQVLEDDESGDGVETLFDELGGRVATGKERWHESKWFERGWTLQELIAPREVRFYDRKWQLVGSRNDELLETISDVTKVPKAVFHDVDARFQVSVAQRMSWAARRRTTRIEDEAYSLLGIFGVSLPLLYGEGRRAFVRLQEEIIKVSTDHSIFAWRESSFNLNLYHTIMDGSYGPVDEWVQEQLAKPQGEASSMEDFFEVLTTTDTWKDFDKPRLLAISPSSFRGTCANIVSRGRRPSSVPYSMTNQGLRITLPVFQHPHEGWMAMLNCRDWHGVIALRLLATGKDEFIVGSAPLKIKTRARHLQGSRTAVAYPHQAAVAKMRTITIAREWPDKVSDVITTRLKAEGLVYVNLRKHDLTRFPLEDYVDLVFPPVSTVAQGIAIIPLEKDGLYFGGLAFSGVPVLGSFVVCFAYDSMDTSSDGFCEITQGAANAKRLAEMCKAFGETVRRACKDPTAPRSLAYIRDQQWGNLPIAYLVRAELQWQVDIEASGAKKWQVDTGEIALKINLGPAFSARWSLLALETRWYGEAKFSLPLNPNDLSDTAFKISKFSKRFRRKLALDPDAPYLFAGFDLSGSAFLGMKRRTIFLIMVFSGAYQVMWWGQRIVTGEFAFGFPFSVAVLSVLIFPTLFNL